MMILPEDYQIVLKLESNPLMSYSDLAADLGVSWPTAKKRVNDLKSRGVIRTPVAIYNIDFDTHYWKTDREYVVENPLEELRQAKILFGE